MPTQLKNSSSAPANVLKLHQIPGQSSINIIPTSLEESLTMFQVTNY